MHKTHTMEMIFPELLFVVFSLCALFLMTTGVMSYQEFNQGNEQDVTTALAYIKTKVDTNNHMNQIEVTTIDNTPCLLIKNTIDEEVYKTYIYVYQNQLSELWIPEKETPHLSDGIGIMDIQTLSFSIDKQTLTFEVMDEQHHQKQLSVYLYGGPSL